MATPRRGPNMAAARGRPLSGFEALPAVLVPLALQWLCPRDLGAAACASRACRAAVPLVQRLWRRHASSVFGEERLPADAAAVDWASYCFRRQSHGTGVFGTSPLALVQERFRAVSPFQVLLACILTSRTSGREVVHEAIDRVVALLPTPAAVPGAPWDAVRVAMRPLGMQAQRERAVRRMAEQYTALDWKDPMELYGVGPFGAESYRLLTGNETPLHEARFGRGVCTDRSTRAYASWLERELGGGGKEGGRPGKRAPAKTKRKRPPPAKRAAASSARAERAKRRRKQAAPAAAPAPYQTRSRTRSSFLVPPRRTRGAFLRGGDGDADK